jgi:hypothetical protein
MHKCKILSCKIYGLKHIALKNSTPILREAVGGTIAQFHCQATIFFVAPASLQYHGPSKWVWLTLEIKHNHWSILKNKDVIYYQLRPDLQTYGHGPRYTADTDAAVIDVCTQKYQLAAWWLLLPQRTSSESNGDMWIKFFMHETFLRRRGLSQIRWSAWNDPLHKCSCPLLLILL